MNKDALEDFFIEPTKEKFLEFYNSNVGESDNLDFKAKWIEYHKIAQIILGIANSGGGVIVFGVAENEGKLDATGLTKEDIKDSAEFIKKIEKFIPNKILPKINLLNFDYDDDAYTIKLKGKMFQAIFINISSGDLPVICEADGDKISKGAIYIRRGTSTELINNDELQALIIENLQFRQETVQCAKLRDELLDLETLYDFVKININKFSLGGIKNSALLSALGQTTNQIVPEKSFEDFIKETIEIKQKMIKNRLNIK